MSLEGQLRDQKSLRAVIGKTADWAELVKDCIAFANASGGQWLLGIEDGQAEPPAGQRIPADLPDTLRRKLAERTVTRAPGRGATGERRPTAPGRGSQWHALPPALIWLRTHPITRARANGGRQIRPQRGQALVGIGVFFGSRVTTAPIHRPVQAKPAATRSVWRPGFAQKLSNYLNQDNFG